MKPIVLVVMLCCLGRAQVSDRALDRELASVLQAARFTGTAGAHLEGRLGRRVDRSLADLGRLLFFDKILNLHSDNSCAGCHAPNRSHARLAVGVMPSGVVTAIRGAAAR